MSVPAPWLQVEPSAAARGTFYTQSLPGGTLSEENLQRGFLEGRLDILGPKFARTYGQLPEGAGPRRRHTIEPRLNYLFLSSSSDAADVIRFDEVDALQGDRNLVNFSLTTRLFSKRPTRGPSDNLTIQTHESSSLSLSQSYSFDDPLSRSTILNDDSRLSPIVLTYRYNPTRNASVNLSSRYDILFDEIASTSISTTLRLAGRCCSSYPSLCAWRRAFQKTAMSGSFPCLPASNSRKA